MAASMSKASIAVSDVKDILTCAVCLEDVKEPRLLACSHSFCTACLSSLQLVRSRTQQKLPCPKCRKQTNVPNGKVCELPMDYKLNVLCELQDKAKAVEKSPGVEPVVCVACQRPSDKSKKSYYHYCKTCHDHLCESCSDAHKNTAVFKDHDMVRLTGKDVPDRQRCMDHPLKYKEYYCKECKLLVCSVCVIVAHREHYVKQFEECDRICRKELESKELDLWRTFHVPIYYTGFSKSTFTQPLIDCLDDVTESVVKKISASAVSSIESITRQRDEFTDLIKKRHLAIQRILSADVLNKRCETLQWSKGPCDLLNGYQNLSNDIDSLLKDNNEEKLPRLVTDREYLYTDFYCDSTEPKLGRLGKMTIDTFIIKKGFDKEKKL